MTILFLYLMTFEKQSIAKAKRVDAIRNSASVFSIQTRLTMLSKNYIVKICRKKLYKMLKQSPTDMSQYFFDTQNQTPTYYGSCPRSKRIV